MADMMGNLGFWFDDPAEDVADSARGAVMSIKQQQEARQADLRRFAAIYRDRATVGFNPGEWMPTFDDVAFIDRVSMNVVKCCIDTAVARLAMHKPMPRFVTAGGYHEKQEKARLMEKLSCAVMRRHDIYRLAADAMRDAAVYGIGFLSVRSDGERMDIRRLHPSRVFVDDQACLDGPPTVLFTVSHIAADALAAQFPNEAEAVGAARAVFHEPSTARGQLMVEYVEAWHLSQGDKPGRHIAFVDSPFQTKLGGRGLLIDEEWDGPFPLAVVRWQPDLMGFWGVGVTEMLQGIQFEIHETARKIQLNHQLLSIPYLLTPIDADIPDEVFGSNEEGRIIKYSGTQAPTVVTPPAVNPQSYEHLDRLWAKAFEIVGISQLSATQQKPAGLNSGIALRTYLDVESQRFSQIQRQWEDLFVQIAKLIVDAAARIPGFKAALADGGKLETITMEDARMAEGEYEVQVWPASSLPMSPAGRLDRVVELAQAGMVGPEEARELLDFPDLEKASRLANAAFEDFQSVFEHMLRTGEYIEPLPWMEPQTLQTGLRMCSSYWHRARVDGADQERTDLLVRWMSEAADMLNPGQEAGFDQAVSMKEMEGQPMGGVPPMPPGALPGGMPNA